MKIVLGHFWIQTMMILNTYVVAFQAVVVLGLFIIIGLIIPYIGAVGQKSVKRMQLHRL